MGALETLLERNRTEARPFEPAGTPRLCLITCDDPELTAQLEGVLGLRPGEATVIRLPAGGGGLGPELLPRVVAKAALVDECTEVLLLTHGSCSLHDFDTNDLIGNLGRFGIPRSAVPYDLRELVGASRNPRELMRDAADQLRRCAFLPAALLIHIAHLDEKTGAITVVEHGAEHQVTRTVEITGQVSGYEPGPLQPLAWATGAEIVSEAPTNTGVGDAPVISVELPQPTMTPAMTVSIPQMSEVSLAPMSVGSDAYPVIPPPIPLITLANEDTPRPASAAAVSVSGWQSPTFRPNPGLLTAAEKKKLKAKKGGPPPPPPAGSRSPSVALSPELISALDKVRTFIQGAIESRARRETRDQLSAASSNGASQVELIRIAIKPVLDTGQKRTRVIDELILVKDKVGQLPPSQAADVLRSLFP